MSYKVTKDIIFLSPEASNLTITPKDSDLVQGFKKILSSIDIEPISSFLNLCNKDSYFKITIDTLQLDFTIYINLYIAFDFHLLSKDVVENEDDEYIKVYTLIEKIEVYLQKSILLTLYPNVDEKEMIDKLQICNLISLNKNNDPYANIVTYQCSDNLNITTFLCSEY